MNSRLRQFGTALALLLAVGAATPAPAVPAPAAPAPAAPAAKHGAARTHAPARPGRGRPQNAPPPGSGSLGNVISTGVSVQRGQSDGGSGGGSEYAVSAGVSVEKQTATGGSTSSSLFAVSPGVSVEKLTAGGGGGTGGSEFVVSPGVSVEKLTATGGGGTDGTLFVVSPGVSVEKLTTAGGPTGASLFVLSPGVSVQRVAVGGYTLTTTLTGGPAEGAAACESSATFTFAASSTDPSPSFVFVYRVDGGPWQGPIKSTSVTLGPLSDGPHTFEVAAIDELGNEDPNPAKRTFTVDTLPPSILQLTAKPTVTGATVTWTTDKPATSQVEYEAQGTTTWIKSPLDSSLVTAHSVTLSGLIPATVYAYRARSTDACGQETVSAPLAFTTVQDTPPTTTITGGPADGATVCDSTATFTFSGSDAYTPVDKLRYEHRLDGAAWSAPSLTKTVTFPGLADGVHTFEVAAVNEAGQVDAHPAKHTFTVDAQPPVISGVTAGTPTLTGAVITWTTDKPATSQVEYRVQGTTDWTSTTLDTTLVTAHTVALSGLLPNVTYEFRARSSDACDHAAVSPIQTLTTAADTTPPATTITSGPADGSTVCDAAVTFTVSGSDNYTAAANLRYQYRVDGGAWSAIQTSATITLTGLTDGPHTFEVAAIDEAGNVDPHPAKRTFTVDTAPPVISAIAVTTPTLTGAVITWTTDKPATSQVDYRVQGTTDWTSTTPGLSLVTAHSVALSGLLIGVSYEFRVHSTDACDHAAVSPAQTLTTKNPVPTIISLSPTSALVGATGLTLTINGSGFIAGSTVTFGTITGLVPVAGSVTPTQLQVAVPDSALTRAGPISVTVTNPAPGGGTSNVATFTITVPAPVAPVLQALVAGDAQVSLIFTTVPNATSYSLKRAAQAGGPYTTDVTGITATAGAATVTAIDPNQPNGTLRYYVVSAVGPGGESPNSNELSTTPRHINLPPTVTLTSPTDGTTLTAPGAPTLSATASDPDGTVAQVEFFQNNVSVGVVKATPYTLPISGLAVGTYTFKAVATDNSGATATSATATITVSPPPVGAAILTGPADQSTVCTGTVVFTWTGYSDTTPPALLRYQYQLDGGAWSDPTTATQQTLSGLAEGLHTFTLRLLNADGSIAGSPVSRSFYVSLTPPTLLSDTVDARDTRAVINWTTSKPTVGQIEYGTTTAYGKNAPADTLSDGAHHTSLTGLATQTTYHYRIHFTDGCHAIVSDDQTFTTSALLIPNLSVTSLAFPNPVTAQSQITLSWAVLDSGPGDATGAWTDSVYLSPTNTLNLATATLLGTYPAPTTLQMGEQYTQLQSVTLPNVPLGNYYVILVTNSGGTLHETTTSDNALAMPIVFLRKQTLIAAPDQIPLALGVNAPQAVTLNLSNLSDAPMTGITATVTGASPNIHVQVTPPTSLAAMTGDKALITVTATNDSVLSDTVIVNLTDQQGDTATATLALSVTPNRPVLTASPSPISHGMTRGGQTLVEVTLTNVGAATATGLNVSLPNVPWLALASPATLGDLAPGASARIVLLLTPDIRLPLGLYSGSIAVNGSNIGLSIPFAFRNVSDAKGNLKVVAQDEFSFFADTRPNVAGAHVVLTDTATNTPVVDGVTDSSGILSVQGVTEASYSVTVTADGHADYHGTINLIAGKTNEIDPFLSRQLVTYTFTVVPIDLQDHYGIQVTPIFATNVPAPVITISPKLLDLSKLSYDAKGQSVVNFTITNHGLIAADDTSLTFPARSDYRLTPALGALGKLAAMTTMTVPVTVTRLSTGKAARRTGTRAPANDAPPDPCTFQGLFLFQYFCGLPVHKNDSVNVATGLCGALMNIPPPTPPVISVDPSPPIPPNDGTEFDISGLHAIVPQEGGPPITVTRPSFCDPCTAARLDALVNVYISLTPAQDCIDGYNGVFETSDLIAVDKKDARGYLKILAHSVKTTNSALKCSKNITASVHSYGLSLVLPDLNNFDPEHFAKGAESILHACDGLPNSSNQFNNLLTNLDARLNRYYPIIKTFSQLLGAQIWLQTGYGTSPFDILIDQFDEDINPGPSGGAKKPSIRRQHLTPSASNASTLDDLKISEAERQDLLALPLPRKLASSDINKLVDRWNRTVDYAGAGIFNLSDVPAGQSTDFIAFDQTTSNYAAAKAAVNANRAEGITDPAVGLSQAEGSLEEAILAPQSEGTCAEVKLQLDHSVAITRTAFKATLQLDNSAQNVPLSNIKVALKVTDQVGNDRTSLFVIGTPTASGFNAVDGTGSLPNGTTGTASWTILPTRDAAANGATRYFVSGEIDYNQSGTNLTIPLFPTGITVMPDPYLKFHYFLQRDVYSDDPFTPEVEPAEPFALGLLVVNVGKGMARDLTITSSQPKIIDNQKGLDVAFKIIGTQVNADATVSPTLKVNLGGIAPDGGTGVADFLLISSLSGQFLSDSASFRHTDDLGSAQTSLVDSVDTHSLEHVVRVVDPIDDGRPDFLTDDIPDVNNLPDTLWNSDGSVSPVTPALNGVTDGTASNANPTVHLAVPNVPFGFVFIRLDDPGQNLYQLASVVRSDGKVIRLGDNAWTTHRIIRLEGQAPFTQNRLYLFDDNSTGAYTLTYQPITPIVPMVSLTSPHDGDIFSPNTTLTMAATATSIQASIKELDFYDGSTLIGTSLTVPFTAPYLPAAGPHTLLAVATDANGTRGRSAPVRITVSPVVTPPPIVQITGPADGTDLIAPATVTVSATASEPGGTIAKVDFYSNGVFLGSTISAPYALTLENLPAGADTLTAVATDTQNRATTSAPVTLQIEPSLTETGAAILRIVSAVRQTTPGQLMVTVQNSGGTNAVTVALGVAHTKWGGKVPLSITPASVPMLAPNSGATFMLQFPASATGSLVLLSGTYSGRNFGGVTRVTP